MLGHRSHAPLVNVAEYLQRVGAWAMYLDDSIAQLKIFEGNVPWMYVDTVAVVTVANGRALEKVGDALALPFGLEGRRATANQIAAEYARVKAMPKGMLPGHYRVGSSPVLDAETISAMLTAKVDEFDQALRVRLAGYVAAPDAAKIALLDMAYNLGVDGLLKFTHLCVAVEEGLWLSAAALCHRQGPSLQRNEWTAAMFKAAAADGSGGR